MRALFYLAEIMTAATIIIAAGGGKVTAVLAATNPPAQDDMAAIERLHQQDVEATLSGKADDFAKLWSDDAVRMEPGGPAEVGKPAIYAGDKRAEQHYPGAKTLSYKPDIRDVQIVDGWAFEWGYFETSFKESAEAKPVNLRGKLLRILKRQPDGSWKFARVMWNTAK